MAPSRKDFIGFILDAEKSEDLTRGFLAQHDATKLHKFFVEKGYTEIPKADCKDILTVRDRLEGQRIPREGEGPCPAEAKY